MKHHQKDLKLQSAGQNRTLADQSTTNETSDFKLAARHGLTHGMGIADVPGNDFDAVANLGCRIVEPAPGAPGIVFDKGAYLCPVCGEPLHQMGADKPARACHKNLRHSASHARVAAGRPDAGMLGEYG